MAVTRPVAAIDFGTTFSGYAFSTTTEFKNHPLKLNPNQSFIATMIQTCLLLDKNLKLVSFGDEAILAYKGYLVEEKADNFHYFHGFKMILHQNYNLSRSTVVKDFKGKAVNALVVFSKSIGALKSLLLTSPEFQATGIKQEDVRWVLTVPGIWSDAGKQFMRLAATEAGIPGTQLKIALEPEAASVYCQHLPLDKLTGAEKDFSITQKGTKYMVVDLGGGVADITVHEKLEGGKLKELHKDSGRAFGGNAVNSKFIRTVFTEVVGKQVMSELAETYPASYLDLYENLETVKRTVTPELEGTIDIPIPIENIELVLEQYQKTFRDVLESSPISGKVALVGDNLIIDAEMMKEFFSDVIDKITNRLKAILKRRETNGVSTLVLVGGFSKSLMVQSAIRQAFPHKRVVIPEDVGLSVLKGAVIYGHQLETVVSRISRYSYEIETFDSGKHTLIEVVSAGTSIPNNQTFIYNVTIISPFQTTIDIKIKFSNEKLSAYTDHNSFMLLGNIDIKLPDEIYQRRKLHDSVSVTFHLGGTELKVTAVSRDKELRVNLNLLG